MKHSNWLLRILLAIVLAAGAGACGAGSGSSTSSITADDDVSPADDDASPADDDASPADDDVSPADDDISPADDDSSPSDDDDTTRMVLVPAGSFEMGCEPADQNCNVDEYPLHQVDMPDYYIDVYEVTNASYAKFLNAHGNVCDGNPCAASPHAGNDLGLYQSGTTWLVDAGYENRPVILVSWYGANDYCASINRRLPTEAEREKAGKGGSDAYIYPWGNTWLDNAANYDGSTNPYQAGPQPWTTPVGYFDGTNHGGAFQTANGASPYGAYDLVGNVWDWVSDWYDQNYYSETPAGGWVNPQGPTTGADRVLKGGGWGSTPVSVRNSLRDSAPPDSMLYYEGFRCARD